MYCLFLLELITVWQEVKFFMMWIRSSRVFFLLELLFWSFERTCISAPYVLLILKLFLYIIPGNWVISNLNLAANRLLYWFEDLLQIVRIRKQNTKKKAVYSNQMETDFQLSAILEWAFLCKIKTACSSETCV